MPFDVIGIIILIAFLISAFLYFGKSAGISIIFSIPIATFLFDRFPYTDILINFTNNWWGIPVMKGILFAIIILLVFWVVRQGVSVVFPWNPVPKMFEDLLITIIVSGLLILSVATIIDQSLVQTYLPSITKILAVPNILFWWTLGGLISLLFILNRS